MKIVIAGASGLVGSILGRVLQALGHDVRRLVRREARAADEIAWNPDSGRLSASQLDGTDAIVNLAGENIGAGRWTKSRHEAILRSRVDATRTLVATMTAMSRKPSVLLNASAAGFYGNRRDEVLNESSSMGTGFLPGVCLAWETHAAGAARLGVRTVCLRFGTILALEGGALAKMLPLFRWGFGGRMGSGQQWMSWIAIDDAVRAIVHVLGDERCSGPVNVVAPGAVTNVEFARTLGRVLGRPAVLPAPAWALRLAFGSGMANEALLASTRAAPVRLSELDFAFRHAALEGALRDVLQA